MSYNRIDFAYKDPITTQKLDQMEYNSVWANEHGIFGCTMDITGTSTIQIGGGRMAIDGVWLSESSGLTALTAETNAHWENGTTQEGSATSWYVVGFASGSGFNVLFRASAPAYSDTSSGTATGMKLYDKTGTTWYRYIAEVWNDSGNAVSKTISSVMPERIVKTKFYQTGDFHTGATILNCTASAPINTEGNEFMILPFISADPNNKILTETIWKGGNSINASYFTVALFRDNITTALIASTMYNGVANSWPFTVPLNYCELAGTAGTITYKIRAGGAQAGTTYFNGTGDKQYLSGTLISSIKLTELGR